MVSIHTYIRFSLELLSSHTHVTIMKVSVLLLACVVFYTTLVENVANPGNYQLFLPTDRKSFNHTRKNLPQTVPPPDGQKQLQFASGSSKKNINTTHQPANSPNQGWSMQSYPSGRRRRSASPWMASSSSWTTSDKSATSWPHPWSAMSMATTGKDILAYKERTVQARLIRQLNDWLLIRPLYSNMPPSFTTVKQINLKTSLKSYELCWHIRI